MVPPIEPISLTVGAVALASLFSTCLECFDLIDTERNFSRDYEIAITKLDAHRTIFGIWGGAIGLDGGGDSFNKDILGVGVQTTIYRLLQALQSLFQDAEKFRKRYGMKRVQEIQSKETSVGVTDVFGWRSRIAILQRNTKFSRKVRWAIHDKNKFDLLLTDLKELIDQLRDITRAAADLEMQRNILKAEVSNVSNVHGLELLEEATKDDDPELSEVASERIVQVTGSYVASTRASNSLFTGTIYHTAKTHVTFDQFDLKSEANLDDIPEFVTRDFQQLQLDETYIPIDSSSNPDLAYGQQNNLTKIQNWDRLQVQNVPILNRKSTSHSSWRVAKELHDFWRAPYPLISFCCQDTDLTKLLGSIQGPSGTPYEGGVFFINIKIPKNYPFESPKFHFLTPILHPNVSKSGEILLDEPTFCPWTIASFLVAIVSLLHSPDWLHGCSPEVMSLASSDLTAFEAKCRILTQRYAHSTSPRRIPYQEYYPDMPMGLRHMYHSINPTGQDLEGQIASSYNWPAKVEPCHIYHAKDLTTQDLEQLEREIEISHEWPFDHLPRPSFGTQSRDSGNRKECSREDSAILLQKQEIAAVRQRLQQQGKFVAYLYSKRELH